MDSIGVIPEPAAISTCRPGAVRSGLKDPAGACTSMTSPARTWWISHPDTAPPATSRTPIRGACPAGAQIEYERRSSPLFSGQRLAGGEAERLAQIDRNVEPDGCRVLGQRLDVGHSQGIEVGCGEPSDLLDVLEGLLAVRAAVQRLARRCAERRGLLGRTGTASWAGDRHVRPGSGSAGSDRPL